MKLLYILTAVLAMTAAAQIPGTIPINSPIAPNATNSNYSVTDARYIVGGAHDEFLNVGDWLSRTWLPASRMRIGMTARAAADTNNYYMLRSISPEVWQPIPYFANTAGLFAATNGIGENPTFTGTTTFDIAAGDFESPHAANQGYVAGWSAAGVLTNVPMTLAVAAGLDGRVTALEGGGGGGGGTNGVTVLESMEALRVLASTPPTVFLKSYHPVTGVNLPQGTGTWGWFPTSTYATNRAVMAKPWGAAAGRYLPIFEDGKIDITKFGARDGYTDNQAVVDAWAMQQDNTWPDKILFVPVGVYGITTTLANVNNSTRMIIQGVNRGYGNASNGVEGASRLTMDTANTPILSVVGAGNIVDSISLIFTSIQPSGNTQAICIKHNADNVTPGAGGGDLSRSRFSNLHLKNGAYGYYGYNANFNVYSLNNTWQNILVDRYAISALYFGCPGTTSELSHIYVQNMQNGATDYTPGSDNQLISSVSKAGTEITLVVAEVPPNLAVNRLMYVGNVSGVAGAQGYHIVKSVSGTTIKYDLPSDPGGVISETSGFIGFYPKTATGTAAIYIGPNMEWQGTSIDVENTIHPAGCLLRNDGIGSIGTFHAEFTYPSDANFYPIRNRGSLNIANASFCNMGPALSGSGYLMYNQNSEQADLGILEVGTLSVRDIANVTNTLVVGISTNLVASAYGAKDIRVGTMRDWGNTKGNVYTQTALTTGDIIQTAYASNAKFTENETLTGASGTQDGPTFKVDVNQSGTAGNNGFVFNYDYTAIGSGAKNVLNFKANDRSFFRAYTNFASFGPGAAASESRLDFQYDQVLDSVLTFGGNSMYTSDPLTKTSGRTFFINTSGVNSNTQIGNGSPNIGLRIGSADAAAVVSRLLHGQVTLVAGTATVTHTNTAASRVFFSMRTPGGTAGDYVYVSAYNGTNFVVTSSNVADTSEYNWMLVQP